jgi:hypothetical protein
MVEGQLVLLELADGQRRAVDRERRAMTLTRSRRAGARRRWRGFVDAPADLAHDPLADVHQLLVVAEADVGELDLAETSM